MVGNILKMIQLEPVQFKSPAETKKLVAADSKLFSIYADGIVPGYQRKTHVRIHAVIDIRGAPQPGAAFLQTANAVGGQQLQAALGGQNSANKPTGDPTAADAIQAAMMPDPGGTVVYYRME